MTKYTIKSTGDSSDKYGPCECCGKHASEMFHQWSETTFTIDGEYGKTFDRGNKFGHKECLMAHRSKEPVQC